MNDVVPTTIEMCKRSSIKMYVQSVVNMLYRARYICMCVIIWLDFVDLIVIQLDWNWIGIELKLNWDWFGIELELYRDWIGVEWNWIGFGIGIGIGIELELNWNRN